MTEHKPIPGFQGYFVDTTGRVWSDSNWRGKPYRPLKYVTDKNGYLRVRLVVAGERYRKGVHALVAQAFHGPRPSPSHQVRHLNGIKTDNRPDNLAWGTPKENGEDKVRLGESSKGSDNGCSKLTETEVAVIKSLLARGASQSYLARLFDVASKTISHIETGDLWTHVEPILPAPEPSH